MYESNSKVKTAAKLKAPEPNKVEEVKQAKEEEPIEVPEFRKPFKTVMCYRFETYGKCPFDKTCTYAHGKKELEKYVAQHQAHLKNYYRKFNEKKQQQKAAQQATTKQEEPHEEEYYDEEYGDYGDENYHSGWNKNLFKTEMCRNILRDGKCPYNPCYFAHSQAEKRDPRTGHLYYNDI